MFKNSLHLTKVSALSQISSKSSYTHLWAMTQTGRQWAKLGITKVCGERFMLNMIKATVSALELLK